MIRPAAYFWKRTPFLRLLPGLIAGILIQWYADPGLNSWLWILPFPLIILITYSFISHFRRFSLPAIPGIATTFIFLAIGGALTWYADVRNDANWIGKNYSPRQKLLVTISAPLVEKERSWRADAEINAVFHNNKPERKKGKIIIYFSKDSLSPQIGLGSKLVITKPLQEISAPANPAAFDYKRYCLFQGITHQVYLLPRDYILLAEKEKPGLTGFIFRTKENVLAILRRYITGPTEAGLAEALLLGYKNDLDKTLMQSYSNTGVVHIIAVSGLHLGLVYMLLGMLCRPLRKKKGTGLLSAIIIIAGLWLFSLLAGAQPSVLRSALMFTCIVVGESMGRKTSVFNTLALSAFLLICINPFILWDVGFLLSYAAVASIIIFMKPIYNWFYFKNPLIDLAWKMNAVTLAAQVLTLPITFYYFNQFPPWFMVTNFIAVPLSSAILLGEIFLCAVSFLPSIAALAGKAISWTIALMNNFIDYMGDLPFALLTNIQVSTIGMVMLFFIIAGLTWWLMGKSSTGAITTLVCILIFAVDDTRRSCEAAKQRMIVVYHAPGKTAVDIIEGKNYWYYGDGALVTDQSLQKFHLSPARIAYRIKPAMAKGGRYMGNGCFEFSGKKIFVPKAGVRYKPGRARIEIDVLLVSGNQFSRLKELASVLNIHQVVLDSSVPARAAASWKKELAGKSIPIHDVATDGAFVMNL